MSNSNPLPSTYRFDYADYQGLGPIFQKFIANLDLFTVPIYTLINGGLGFANLQRSVFSTTVKAGSTTPLSFVNPLPVAPSGLAVCKVLLASAPGTAITNAVSVANWNFDGRNINILDIVGLTGGSTYSISIEVF